MLSVFRLLCLNETTAQNKQKEKTTWQTTLAKAGLRIFLSASKHKVFRLLRTILEDRYGASAIERAIDHQRDRPT